MRLKFKPWAKDFIKDRKDLFIQDEADLIDFISQSKEVRIEVGCGKGRFIRTLAMQNPDITFVAVERYPAAIVMAAKEIEDAPLPNLKFFSCDIFKLVDNNQVINKFDLLYLNFSDPWPKARHEKRRLTAPAFMNLYADLLKTNGHIEFKTDNQGLFEYSLSSMSKSGWFFDNISLDLHQTDRENIKTEYEEKFSNLGFRICYLEARRGQK